MERKFEIMKFITYGKQFIDKKKIVFFDHHLCHAASTFFASGFKHALVFTIDGSGEENSEEAQATEEKKDAES